MGKLWIAYHDGNEHGPTTWKDATSWLVRRLKEDFAGTYDDGLLRAIEAFEVYHLEFKAPKAVKPNYAAQSTWRGNTVQFGVKESLDG